MYKIEQDYLMFAWQSDDIMQDVERETAFIVKTLPIKQQSESADRILFTDDERMFFEKHIQTAMCMLFAMFQKFASSDINTFFIDTSAPFSWSEITSKANGFSVVNRKKTDSGYNPVRLKFIDYDARRFLSSVIVHEWHKLTGDSSQIKESEQKMNEIYSSLFCNLSYLRLHEYSKSYILTL